ncbi:hypothetical protein T12_12432 [Trichinella patagoniensis]|uniref:Uncharacterized protein n=1 Tax=Trichinella patagoniensis TaxID=990121 RepID=A0A0V1A3W5_9BILA|nr:hypothetical protein T12_12432 [Trichinella patagoniensis]
MENYKIDKIEQWKRLTEHHVLLLCRRVVEYIFYILRQQVAKLKRLFQMVFHTSDQAALWSSVIASFD